MRSFLFLETTRGAETEVLWKNQGPGGAIVLQRAAFEAVLPSVVGEVLMKWVRLYCLVQLSKEDSKLFSYRNTLISIPGKIVFSCSPSPFGLLPINTQRK